MFLKPQLGSTHRDKAMASPTTHYFRQGLGYFNLAEPPAMPTIRRGGPDQCMPPKGTKNGSAHLLSPPNSIRLMEFSWVAKERAWMRYGGIRMAFSAEYLAAHGWQYKQPKG